MQLSINTQMARLGLEITKPWLSMSNSQPKLEIESSPGRLEIKSPPPRILIDQTQCFADVDHRGNADFLSYWLNFSHNKYMENLSKRVQDGNRLAAIHSGFSIADLCAEAMVEDHIFDIIAVPGELPRIEAIVQAPEINYIPGQVLTRLNPGQTQNEFQWGKVQAYMLQKNLLEIEWKENTVDLFV